MTKKAIPPEGVVIGNFSAGQIPYALNGSEVTGGSNLFFDPTNSRLGIGTNTFAEVADKLRLHESNTGQPVYARFTNGTTEQGVSDGYSTGIDGSGCGFMWNYEEEPLYFGTNNAKRFQIESNGDISFKGNASKWKHFFSSERLAYGTATPFSVLHLHKTTTEPNELRFTSSTTGQGNEKGVVLGSDGNGPAYMWNYENSTLYFGTNNTLRLTLDAVGNLVFAGVNSKLTFTGSNGNKVSLKSPSSPSANTIYELPVSPPSSNGQILSSTTSGVMSWVDAGGSTKFDGGEFSGLSSTSFTTITFNETFSSPPNFTATHKNSSNGGLNGGAVVIGTITSTDVTVRVLNASNGSGTSQGSVMWMAIGT